MQLTTLQIANNLIGVSLLAVLAAALIAGQARVRFDNESTALADPGQQQSSGLILTRRGPEKFGALPLAVDSMRALPLTIEISVDGVSSRPAHVGGAGQPVE